MHQARKYSMGSWQRSSLTQQSLYSELALVPMPQLAVGLQSVQHRQGLVLACAAPVFTRLIECLVYA